jgi:hypothetical protein
MKDIPKHSELLCLWSVQESVLQSYRGIFISSQSFLLSGASILFALSIQNPIIQWAIYPVAVLGFSLSLLWKKLTDERGRAVYFCQSLIIKYERDKEIPPPLTALKEFVREEKNNQVEYMKNDEEYIFVSDKDGTEGFTRKSLQKMPIIFICLWPVFALVAAIVVNKWLTSG